MKKIIYFVSLVLVLGASCLLDIQAAVAADTLRVTLRPIGETIDLKALDGRRSIAKARNVFKRYIDQNFVVWQLDKTRATKKAKVQVYDMLDDGNFMDVFRSLPGTWEQKCLSQNQVVEFCKITPGRLRKEGSGTLFLCKRDEGRPVDEARPDDNLVVANVYVTPRGLQVAVFKLSHGFTWLGSGYYVVAPKHI